MYAGSNPRSRLGRIASTVGPKFDMIICLFSTVATVLVQNGNRFLPTSERNHVSLIGANLSLGERDFGTKLSLFWPEAGYSESHPGRSRAEMADYGGGCGVECV